MAAVPVGRMDGQGISALLLPLPLAVGRLAAGIPAVKDDSGKAPNRRAAALSRSCNNSFLCSSPAASRSLIYFHKSL
jgi:hypothetical protein